MKIRLSYFGVIVCLLVIASAFAVGYLMTSNTLQITVNSKFTLSLASNSTNIEFGESVALTATCTDTTFNGQVTFQANGTTIGSPNAVSGVASIVWTPASDGVVYDVVATATHP